MGKLFSAFAMALAILVAAPTVHAGGGGSEPFPLDYPLPFPWNTIEGVWEVKSRDYVGTFSFEVQNDCNGRQILRVLQLDDDSNFILANGVGYKVDRTEQVTAAMSGPAGSYMLYVGAYEDTHIMPAKKVYVLRVVSFTGSSELRFKINKLTNKVPKHNPGFDPSCSY